MDLDGFRVPPSSTKTVLVLFEHSRFCRLPSLLSCYRMRREEAGLCGEWFLVWWPSVPAGGCCFFLGYGGLPPLAKSAEGAAEPASSFFAHIDNHLYIFYDVPDGLCLLTICSSKSGEPVSRQPVALCGVDAPRTLSREGSIRFHWVCLRTFVYAAKC